MAVEETGPTTAAVAPSSPLPSAADKSTASSRSWWFDAVVFLWPLVVAGGLYYFTEQRAHSIAAEAVKAPPRVVVLDELALIQMVVRQEQLTDIDAVRARVAEVVKPYTDAGYVVIGDMNIVSAPSALVLSRSDLEALYARSKR